MKKEEKKTVVKETKEKKVPNKKTKVEKTAKKETKKSKGNIFSIISIIGRYFRGVVKETKRIKWTSGKDLVKYSIAAIAFVIFFGVYFYGIDWIVLLIRKLAN